MTADAPLAPETTAGKIFRQGILFVVSAPSGAGKSTLTTALRTTKDFVYSVSCTTRAPRPGETHGEDYHFLSPGGISATSSRRVNFSNTRKSTATTTARCAGTCSSTCTRGLTCSSDIDTQGADAIRASADPTIRDALADVFIMPPNRAELRRRLVKRGTETPEQIERRLRNAAGEMARWRDYRYTIISGSVEEDLAKFRAIMRAERYLSRRFAELEF